MLIHNDTCTCFLSSETPFATSPEDGPDKILMRIGEGKINLTGGNWDTVSPAAKDLVLRMLHVDPQQRCTAQQVIRSIIYIHFVISSLWLFILFVHLFNMYPLTTDSSIHI